MKYVYAIVYGSIVTSIICIYYRALCGQFDVVWDSRSLVAINLADHKK